MKRITILILLGGLFSSAKAQNVGINNPTPDASSLLDLTSTDKGLLIPRLSLAATNSNSPVGTGIATALLVYNTATAGTSPNNVTPGFYYWDGSKWVRLMTASSGDGWQLTGNSSVQDATNFIGTTANVPFNIRVNNEKAGRIDQFLDNSIFGYKAQYSNSTGAYNVAIGSYALYSNTTGSFNVANGYKSIYYNSNGTYNVGNGFYALYTNSSGSYNVANGSYALYSNTSGFDNAANGFYALYSNNTGYRNVANGFYALNANTSGMDNAANGSYALNSNTTGSYNVANGSYALFYNTIGLRNVANGEKALYSNTIGSYNVTGGSNALYANSIGSFNVAYGFQALYNNTSGAYNVAGGYGALDANTTGENNTALGTSSNVGSDNLTNATAIGANARVDVSNAMVLGSVSGINGATSNVNVGIGTNSPTSSMDINGGFATKLIKSSGTSAVTLDNTVSVFYIISAVSSVNLPAASTCANRRYVIVNRSGNTRTMSSYTTLTGSSATSIAKDISIEIISDGSNWIQIK